MAANVKFWRLDIDVELEYTVGESELETLWQMIESFGDTKDLNMFNANELVIKGQSIWVDEWNSEDVQWYLEHSPQEGVEWKLTIPKCRK